MWNLWASACRRSNKYKNTYTWFLPFYLFPNRIFSLCFKNSMHKSRIFNSNKVFFSFHPSHITQSFISFQSFESRTLCIPSPNTRFISNLIPTYILTKSIFFIKIERKKFNINDQINSFVDKLKDQLQWKREELKFHIYKNI